MFKKAYLQNCRWQRHSNLLQTRDMIFVWTMEATSTREWWFSASSMCVSDARVAPRQVTSSWEHTCMIFCCVQANFLHCSSASLDHFLPTIMYSVLLDVLVGCESRSLTGLRGTFMVFLKVAAN